MQAARGATVGAAVASIGVAFAAAQAQPGAMAMGKAVPTRPVALAAGHLIGNHVIAPARAQSHPHNPTTSRSPPQWPPMWT